MNMNSNLDGVHHIQNNSTNGKCSTMATGTEATTVTTTTTTASTTATATSVPTSVASIAAPSKNICKSISDSECTTIKCDQINNSTSKNISNFFRKLSGDFTSVVAPAAAANNVDDIEKSSGGGGCDSDMNNVKTCDRGDDSGNKNNICASDPADGKWPPLMQHQQPSYVSGCFAHRHQCGGINDVGIGDNLTEAELRQIISELTSKMEYTERMNWMCKCWFFYVYIFF